MASNNVGNSQLFDEQLDSSDHLEVNFLSQSESTNEASISSQLSLEESLFSNPLLEPYRRNFLGESKASKEDETFDDSFSTLDQDSEETLSFTSDSSHVNNVFEDILAPSQSTETIDSITSSEFSLEQSYSFSEDLSEPKVGVDKSLVQEELPSLNLPHSTDVVILSEANQTTSVVSLGGSNLTAIQNDTNSTDTDSSVQNLIINCTNGGEDDNKNPFGDEEQEHDVAVPRPGVFQFPETSHSNTNSQTEQSNSAEPQVCSLVKYNSVETCEGNRVDCRVLFGSKEETCSVANMGVMHCEAASTLIHPLQEDYPVEVGYGVQDDSLDIVSPLAYATDAIVAIKKKSKTETQTRSRRVSFPEDDTSLITSYLEPVDPWNEMNNVTHDAISLAYRESCDRHRTWPLPMILQQIAALPLSVGSRVECFSLKGQALDASQCECLEEIFRRVQFKTLNFESCELDDDSVIILFDMIEFYDSGTQLNVACNHKISQRGWQACARMLKRSPSIDLLNAHTTNLGEQTMPILARALRLGTRLTCLHLENCNLTGRPMIVLAGALRLNDLLKELYLSDNQLGVCDCIQIENLIHANRHLQLLDIRNNNIQDAGCAHVCEGVSRQSKDRFSENGLRTLVLWNNHLTIQAVSHINTMLQNTRFLQTLNLGKNRLGTEGVLQMKNSLIRNRTLLRLGLQTTRITDEGAVALAEYIADNVIIQRIDLRENTIQVAGLMALNQSFRINKTVIKVDLDLNAKTEPTPELIAQHTKLYLEIKQACQRNQTEAHLKHTASPVKDDSTGTTPFHESCVKSAVRKISLTCESLRPSSNVYLFAEQQDEVEPKRYRSPAPSPSISPCPSPSPSPFLSSSNSRFKVFKVSESGCAPTSTAELALSTSAPATFSLPSVHKSPLSVKASSRPNRFGGGRFTVTKVKERSSFSLPGLSSSRAMSVPALNVPDDDEPLDAPTIVVSSPSNAITGFGAPICDSSPVDEVFDCPNTPTTCSLPNPISTATVPNISPVGIQDLISSVQKDLNMSVEQRSVSVKAPLASMEGASFDTDSEDSELTPQSSHSVHTDDVATQHSWEDKLHVAAVQLKEQ